MRFPGGAGYPVRLTGCPATAGKVKSNFNFYIVVVEDTLLQPYYIITEILL